MGTVNTASVREEIARVEQEIARLSESGKVSYESRMLFNTGVAGFMRFSLQRHRSDKSLNIISGVCPFHSLTGKIH